MDTYRLMTIRMSWKSMPDALGGCDTSVSIALLHPLRLQEGLKLVFQEEADS